MSQRVARAENGMQPIQKLIYFGFATAALASAALPVFSVAALGEPIGIVVTMPDELAAASTARR